MKKGGDTVYNYDAHKDKGIAVVAFVLLSQEEVDGLSKTVHQLTLPQVAYGFRGLGGGGGT